MHTYNKIEIFFLEFIRYTCFGVKECKNSKIIVNLGIIFDFCTRESQEFSYNLVIVITTHVRIPLNWYIVTTLLKKFADKNQPENAALFPMLYSNYENATYHKSLKLPTFKP